MEASDAPSSDQLLGTHRRRIADDLCLAFDEVRTTTRPRFEVLTAPLGWGKTRLVQELFARVAETCQSLPHYWPAQITTNSSTEDPLRTRKRIYPAAFSVSPESIPNYLWWGIRCERDTAGTNIRCLQDAAHQLSAHTDGILRRIDRRRVYRHAAAEGLGALVGMFLPGPVGFGMWAKDQLPELWTHTRNAAQDRTIRKHVRQEGSRRIDADLHGWEDQAEQFGRALDRLLGRDLPLIMILDDAHWADRGTINMLDRLIRADLPILVVATVWPDELRSQASDSATGPPATFGRWVSENLATIGSRVRLHHLHRLESQELGPMIDAVAPRSKSRLRSRLLDLSDGNPLALTLLLASAKVQSAIRNGAIHLEDDELDALPVELKGLLAERWRDLPRPIQQVLSLAGIQGREFVEALVQPSAIATSWPVGMPELDLAADHFGWIDRPDPCVGRFGEEIQFEVAREVGALPRALESEVIESIAAAAQQIRESEEWLTFSPLGRRRALEVMWDAGATSKTDSIDRLSAGLELARINADFDDWIGADRVMDSVLEGAIGVGDVSTSRAAQLFAMETRRRSDRVSESVSMAEQLLNAWKRELGDRDPDMLTLHYQLGLSYASSDNYAAAVTHLESAFEGLEASDPSSIRCLEVAADLAWTLLDWGEAQRALQVATNTLLVLNDVEDVPVNLLHSLELNACEALFESGDVNACIKRETEFVDQLANTYGRADGRTISGIADLASTLSLVGRYADALHLIDSTFEALAGEPIANRALGQLRVVEGLTRLVGGDSDRGFQKLTAGAELLTLLGGTNDPEAAIANWVAELWRLICGISSDLSLVLDAARRLHRCITDSHSVSMLNAITTLLKASLLMEAVETREVMDQWDSLRSSVRGGSTFVIMTALTGQYLAGVQEWDLLTRVVTEPKARRDAGMLLPVLEELRILSLFAQGRRAPNDIAYAISVVRQVESPFLLCQVGMLLAGVGLYSKQPREVLREVLDILSASKAIFGSEWIPVLQLQVLAGQLLAATGERSRARRYLHEIRSVLTRVATGDVANVICLRLANAYVEAGEREVAIDLVNRALELAIPDPASTRGRNFLMLAASVLKRSGASTAAEQIGRSLVAAAHEQLEPEVRFATAACLAGSLLASSPAEAAALLEPVVAARRRGLGSAKDLADALELLSEALEALDEMAQAIECRKAAVDTRIEADRPDSLAVLISRSELSSLLFRAELYIDALAEAELVFNVRFAGLGPMHPDTITAGANVAAPLVKLNRSSEAIQLLGPIVEANGTVQDAHRAVPDALGWLAEAYSEVGDLDRAVATKREEIEGRRGLGDAGLWGAERRLVTMLFGAGRYSEALPYSRASFEDRLPRLGPADSETINAAADLAANLIELGRLDEGIAVLEPIVAGAAQGPDVLEARLYALGWLARAYEKADLFDDAISTKAEEVRLRTVMAIPLGLLAQAELARLLYEAGRYTDAIPVGKAVYDVRLAEWGPANTQTLEAGSNLAGYLVRAALPVDAVNILAPLVEANRAVPATQGVLPYALSWLSKAYSDLAQSDAAIACKSEEVRLRRTMHDPVVLIAEEQLCVMLIQTKQYSEAISYPQAVLDSRLAEVGPAHCDTLYAASNLAAVLIGADRPEEAVRVLAPVVEAASTGSSAPGHLPTALDRLADAYKRAGCIDDAISTKAKEVKIREAMKDPSGLLTVQAALVRMLFDAGRSSEAVPYAQSAFDLAHAEMGPADRITILAAGNLAANLVRTDRPVDAIGVLEPIVEAARSAPAADGSIAFALGWLADAYEGAARVDDAISTKVEELERLETTNDRARLLAVRAGLSTMLFRAGHYEDAIPVARAVLDVQLAELGHVHASTLVAASNLAANLVMVDRPDEAIDVLAPIVEAAETVCAAEGPLPTAVAWLARAYAGAGREDHALFTKVGGSILEGPSVDGGAGD